MQNFNPPNQTEHHLFLIIKVLQFSQSVPKPFLDNIGLNLITLCFYLYPLVFAFLQLLSNAFRNGLPQRTHNHTCCLSLSFLHSVFSNVTSNCLHEKMHIQNGCISLTFFHWVFKCVLKLPGWKEIKLHWLHLFDFSPLWVFKCFLKWLVLEDA